MKENYISIYTIKTRLKNVKKFAGSKLLVYFVLFMMFVFNYKFKESGHKKKNEKRYDDDKYVRRKMQHFRLISVPYILHIS